MKNNKQIFIALGVIIIILLIAALARTKQGEQAKQEGTAAGDVSQTNKTPTQTTTKTTTKTATPSYTSKPPNTYSEYQNNSIQLSDNQNKCKSSATTQYNLLYINKLSGASFESFYNPGTTFCFMRVTGTELQQYSTTTTRRIYFRNVTKSAVLAECYDVNGVTFADSEWKCTDKTTGQSISIAQFNGLIYNNTAH